VPLFFLFGFVFAEMLFISEDRAKKIRLFEAVLLFRESSVV